MRRSRGTRSRLSRHTLRAELLAIVVVLLLVFLVAQPIVAQGVLTVVAIVLGLAGAFAVDRRVAKPMRILRDAVERAAGSVTIEPTPVPDGPAEVAELTERFNAMVAARAASETGLRELNQDLERRVEQRTAQLERSNAELDRFASLAAHDLQEPLRTISGFADLLAERLPASDTESAGLIERINVRADRMRDLIADLLAYARAGTTEPAIQPTDANDAVTEAMEELLGIIGETEATVTIGDLPRVIADPSDLAELFQNLIANAVRFRRPDTEPDVRISARREGELCIFSVTDDGIGIDMRYATRIFEPFRRLHSKDEYPGTGMGLGICSKLIEKQGGRIWVESEPGRGATFSFTLPAV